MAEQTFTSGQILTAAQMTTLQANSGLCFVKQQTVGAGVTTVTVSDAFSSTYDNYRIIYDGGSSSSNVAIQMTLGATTSGYQYAAVYQQYNATSPLGLGSTSASSFAEAGRCATVKNNMVVELYGPFATDETGFRSYSMDYYAASGFLLSGGGSLNNSTSYTSFTIVPAFGASITGGNITVFGYRKS